MNQVLFLVGASLFALLGVAHGALTLRDLSVPRSFTPTDSDLRRAMAKAPLRFAPQTTVWKAWLGFNLSHSLGLFVFGAFSGALAWHDFAIIAGRPVLHFSVAAVGAIYVVLALRFWFWAPAIATVCFLMSALIS